MTKPIARQGAPRAARPAPAPRARAAIRPDPVPAHVADRMDFAGHLAGCVDGAGRGEKTRLKLLGCGLRLLADTGFRSLNVDDVVGLAEIAKGTFYIHFTSKDAFLLELADRYVAFEAAAAPERDPDATTFAQVRDWLAWYEEMFARNIGVVRCLVQAAETSEAMRALWHRRNAVLIDRLLGSYFPPSGAIDPALARTVLRVAGGMIDQSLFERHRVQVGPGRREPDDRALRLELHALLCYRAIYGTNPPADELNGTRELLAWPGR
ncbi:MAG: TetR/AcrR family transcriptional regulator [Sphingomonas sp.]|uniref:TetR/AcrR family transcriptional regulator n=1 Tax=Sphingomonas sp. TaxID=28214 RepID=UPI0025D9A2FB|nr:TetR/AcrR family transcriptional regulator [Sphingomonas sp.]MBX9880354.1 TetR/AcrR family transcriptional regulator [Sphingomonas sp.]